MKSAPTTGAGGVTMPSGSSQPWSLPTEAWGRRLSDHLAEAIRSGDFEAASRLVRQGDGQARSLAKEFTLMDRGLCITVRVLLRLLEDLAGRRRAAADDSAVSDAATMIVRFRSAVRSSGGLDRGSEVEGAPGALTDEIGNAIAALDLGERQFEADQSQRAEEIADAIERHDGVVALRLLELKERSAYLPRHDCLVRFMADSFAWVLRYCGEQELLQFHLATAELQRPGFERWERMSAAEFAWTSAYLLKQHMGQVSVNEDGEKFTIVQSPCGSGGRLRRAGAYDYPEGLPFVETPGPLTFGEKRLPVYCSHCAIWNGVATLRWFGRAHWVFDEPAREDGGCTLHIYKQSKWAPADYAARLGEPRSKAR